MILEVLWKLADYDGLGLDGRFFIFVPHCTRGVSGDIADNFWVNPLDFPNNSSEGMTPTVVGSYLRIKNGGADEFSNVVL